MSRVTVFGLGALLMCPAPAVAAPQNGEPVTYAKHVAPILQEKCQVCHQPNSVGRMSLCLGPRSDTRIARSEFSSRPC